MKREKNFQIKRRDDSPGCSRTGQASIVPPLFSFSREEEEKRRRKRVRAKGVRRKMSTSGSLPSSPLSNDTLRPLLPPFVSYTLNSSLASGDMASTRRRRNRNLIPLADETRRTWKAKRRDYLYKTVDSSRYTHFPLPPFTRFSLYAQLFPLPLPLFIPRLRDVVQRAEAAVENLESSSSSGRRSPWRNSINSVPGALPLSLSLFLATRSRNSTWERRRGRKNEERCWYRPG